MNKNLVIESAYEVIKDGLEWGIGDVEYGEFVNGVVAATDTLLEKLKKSVEEDTNKNEVNELVEECPFF